jgi:hypothetical protein
MRFFAIGLRGVAVCLLLLCTLLVSGNVTLAQTVTVSPVSLGFGVPNGSTVSAPLPLTINVSGDSVTFPAFTLSDTVHFAISSNGCSSGSISGNCVVNLTFTPVTPGLKTASLTITTTGNPSTITVPLSGALGAINVFGETDVNPSAQGASYTNPVIYGNQTLSLSCPAGAPPTGTLSSTPDGLGYVLEDNYLVVAVNGTPVGTGAPAGNVCNGPDSDNPFGSNQVDCYSDPYRGAASGNHLNGVNSDSIAGPTVINAALGNQPAGIPPINISSFLSSLEGTTGSVSFSALDAGGWVAGSSVFLVTNCTNVTTITQPASNATQPGGATYTFNGSPTATVSQVVDLSHSNVDTSNTNLAVTDTPINPADFPALVANTSFAVDNCFVMAGETIPTLISNVAITSGGVLTLTVASIRGLSVGESVGLSGLANATFLNGQTITITALDPNLITVTATVSNGFYASTSDTGTLAIPACKQYQILCTTSTNLTPSGSNCPISQARNEFYSAVFNPANPSILVPAPGTSALPPYPGTNIPTGVAYPMAIDTWAGGPCVFPSTDGNNLAALLCPQNFLTSFSSVGDPGYTTTITTKNPNSTVIPMYGHPQQVTKPVVQGQNAAGWNNASNSNPLVVNFSTQPPFLGDPSKNPALNNFVPAPIAGVTYWVDIPSPDTNSPPTGMTATQVIQLGAQPGGGCPTPSTTPPSLSGTALFPFVSTGSLSGLSDGPHTLNFFSTDCAGTEELVLSKTGSPSPNWGTSFLAVPIMIDSISPTITVVVPAPNATYTANQKVASSYSCLDNAGGSGTLPLPAGCNGPVLTTKNIDTTPTAGLLTTKSFTVTSQDIAGNIATSTVNYNVSCNYASVGISPSTVKRPGLVLITAGIVDCMSAPQTVKVQFTLSGPIGKNCGPGSTVLFTTPTFTIKSGTSNSVSFPFPIAKAACAGTYTITTNTLQGAKWSVIDTVSSMLTVQ